MKDLRDLSVHEATRLRGLAFDLDDTVLDGSALGEDAYRALFRLREAGLRLIACTGRPAGFGDVVQRQWPVDATIAENGAVAFVRGQPRWVSDGLDAVARRARREALLSLAARLIEGCPSAGFADDNDARLTDVTIDIGEHRRVPGSEVSQMQAIARAEGIATHASSVHLHLTFERCDKASGIVGVLARSFGEDATLSRERYGFVGDSGNDGPAFAAFRTTFGVANVRAHTSSLTVAPKFVAPSERGRGFAEIASTLVERRTGRS